MQTPESHLLLQHQLAVSRSDSKNPATTCRGITLDGKPCRRAVALSKSSPSPSPSSTNRRRPLSAFISLSPLSQDATSTKHARLARKRRSASLQLSGDDLSERPPPRPLLGPSLALREYRTTSGAVTYMAASEVDGLQEGTKGSRLADTVMQAAAKGYCWQHKDQAMLDHSQSTGNIKSTSTQGDRPAAPRRGSSNLWRNKQRRKAHNEGGNTASSSRTGDRSSIDSLAERLGILDVSDSAAQSSRQSSAFSHRKTSPDKTRANRFEKQRQGQVHARSMLRENVSLGDDSNESASSLSSTKMGNIDGSLDGMHASQKKKKKQNTSRGLFGFLCCMDDELDHLAPRRFDQPDVTQMMPSRSSTVPRPAGLAHEPSNQKVREALDSPQSPLDSPHSSINEARYIAPSSETLDNLIPKSLSSAQRLTLMTELTRPVSKYDNPGYIYVFWLTEDNKPRLNDNDAGSLIAGSSSDEHRRKGVLSRYSTIKSLRKSQIEPRTILLKIGRAENVHRRLNQWQAQCGHNVSLVRYYPPSSTSSSTKKNLYSNNTTQIKVPHAHKIERLIHLSLADKQVFQTCDVCGRLHREWFEIEASLEGIRAVDDVIRGWVGESLG